MRVLVVEDSDRLQRALVAGLKQRGFAVDAAGDGQVGLERALAGTYDAIVLDLWLPKRDAFVRVDAIPVLGTGKLDLRGVRRVALERLAPSS